MEMKLREAKMMEVTSSAGGHFLYYRNSDRQ